MPPRRPTTSQIHAPNAAAAALGVGINPDKWTVSGLISAMTIRYAQLTKLADDEKARGETRKYRLMLAGAFELATILASYYQEQGTTEMFTLWSHRAQRTSALAYRYANPMVQAMGLPETPGLDDAPRR